MKKTLLIVALILTLLTMAACGNGSSNPSSSTPVSADGEAGSGASTPDTNSGEPVTLVLAHFGGGSLPDTDIVAENLSSITEELINVRIELLPITFAAWEQQINLMVSGGEKLDLVHVMMNNFSTDVAKGKFLAIDQYMDNEAKELKEVVGDAYLSAGQIDGIQYGVPSIRDMAASYGVCFRKDLLEKYGFNADDIKTVEDLEAVYEVVSAGEPDMYMTYGQGNSISIVNQLLTSRDDLGNGFGVLLNRGQDDFNVVNWFSTDEYRGYLDMVRDWYLKGWIVADAVTNTESATTLVKGGQLFSFCTNLKPGYDKQAGLSSGYEMVTSTISPAFSTTTQVGVLSWCLPINCEYPSEAMQFMNLMYTNADVVNAFDWGVEGVHYVKVEGEDNLITYPEGVNESNTGWGLNLGWIFGNQLLSYVWEGNDPDLYVKLKEFNDTAIISKALGFQFDATNVKNEVAALQNVTAEYRLSLEYGMVDVDENLPKFLQALEDAGINKVIAEKQAQLDAWLALQ